MDHRRPIPHRAFRPTRRCTRSRPPNQCRRRPSQHQRLPHPGKTPHDPGANPRRKKVLEIGTLGAYSTIWLARGLPPGQGRIITLEFEPKHADIAANNLAHAKLADTVEIIRGPALQSLATPAVQTHAPFDLIFIDADKQNNPGYFEWALKLSRPGTLIIIDNVIRDGKVADPKNTSSDVIGTRKMNDLIAKENRVTATTLQTVGAKGYDGLALVRVNDATK